jgi:hypothetical protein
MSDGLLLVLLFAVWLTLGVSGVVWFDTTEEREEWR